MIDFQSETLMSLKQATRVLPGRSGEKPIHVATLHRWASRGCRGIKLETLQVGGTRYTSREALQRFFDRLSQQGESGAEPRSAPREPSCGRTARGRDEKEIERLLDQLGL
jgi:hypothetical protein